MRVASLVGLVVTVLVGYYAVFTAIHLLVTAFGAQALRHRESEPATTDRPAITIAVPAYNKRETAVDAVTALLGEAYPISVVFVDDGSTDGTFEAVANAFDLVPVTDDTLGPEQQRYDGSAAPLTLLRQPNRGKAAALNLALDHCDTPLFGVVDADTIIAEGSLTRLVAPFADPAVVACGGSFRVGAPAPGGHSHLPVSLSQRLQALEQLRTLVLRQLGRNRFGLMVHVFGAYSAFRTDLVTEVGGFEDVGTEDFELAVAIRRHCVESNRPCRFVHVPEAVAWTIVPETMAEVGAQRRRWVSGSVETIDTHRKLVGNPTYGTNGALGLPYFLLGEVVWPTVEGLCYLLVPLSWWVGAISPPVALLFLVSLILAGPVLSAVAVVATSGQAAGYRGADQRALLPAILLERFWRPLQVTIGIYSVLGYVFRSSA